MSLSDANPNREADSARTPENAPRSEHDGDDDDAPDAKDSSSTGPLRRQELERHLQDHPADLSACVELASLYRQENRPADAVRVLRKASAFHSDDHDFLWAYEEALLARSLQQLQEVGALATRLKTVEVEEEKQRCEVDWARCRVDVCRARLRRDAGNQHHRLTLVHALKELERFDDAIREAETAAKDVRLAPAAHLLRAQCLEATGKRFESLPAYRAAAMRRCTPAPARIRVRAMRAALNIAETLGLDLSAQRYRTALQRAEAELNTQSEGNADEPKQRLEPALLEWDTTHEKILAEYESATLKVREELNRFVAGFRQARRRERTAVVAKVEGRLSAIHNRYNRRKNQPIEQQRKACIELDVAIVAVEQAIEEVRSVVLRRLDHLPDVSPFHAADGLAKPNTVREAEDAIQQASQEIRDRGRQLLANTPARLIDTVWAPPLLGGLLFVIWTAAALIAGWPQPWIAITAGLLVAFFVFLTLLGARQIPLRRRTRELYPRAEYFYAAAQRARENGKAIAAAIAADQTAALKKQRESELRTAEHWEQEKFRAIEQGIHEKETATRTQLEQELEAIRQHFVAELTAFDEATLEEDPR